MFKSISGLFISTALAVSAVVADLRTAGYGLGTPATAEQIAGWDIDVRPDGLGLPPGSGSVAQGEPLYEQRCATCHGTFGEGRDRWPVLAGGFDTLTEEKPEKTVGSYWPYASTLWDYIHRAMPFFEPQSLSDNETYAITAYILYLNEIVDDDFVLTRENLTDITMPNADGFFRDPRPDIQTVACMNDCKRSEDIRITWDSTELGVTPVAHFKGTGAESSDVVTRVQSGREIYQASCQVCHDQGVAGAPKASDSKDWEERLRQGLETLVKHAIQGFQGSKGYMPPKGGNSQLSDEEVAAAVTYIAESVASR